MSRLLAIATMALMMSGLVYLGAYLWAISVTRLGDVSRWPFAISVVLAIYVLGSVLDEEVW